MAEFVYVNVAPENKHRSDCVTRAITLATGLSYPKVRKMLFHSSRLMQCVKLEYSCYSHLLDDTFKFPRVDCRKLSVGEFADTHPYGTYIIRVEGHATVVKDGKSMDTFDCRDMMCDICWRVK